MADSGSAYPTAGAGSGHEIAVISREFCSPHPVELRLRKKFMSNLEVTDVHGNVLFTVDDKLFSLHNRTFLLDAAATPIVSFQRKIRSMHRRWKVFKGDSNDENDLLFSVKESSYIQFRTKLHVFLASNTKEDVCDFKVEASRRGRSCVIYAGDSSNIIGQMQKKRKFLFGKSDPEVTVYPNVDYAFVLVLVWILEEIEASKRQSSGGGQASGGGGGGGGGGMGMGTSGDV